MAEPVDPNAFKYDIALSFLSADEALATDIREHLKHRFNVFVYTRNQEAIAGTDGEVTLNAVFGAESRTVCVLYRSSWGSTPFTRVEETAIRNRAYDEGYDFAIFVLLNGALPPRWLPRTRIWPNLERWGIDGLIPVLEERIIALGGSERRETARDIASRLQRDLKSKEERQNFLYSPDGVRTAEAHLGEVISTLKRVAADVSEQNPELHLRFQGGSAQATIIGFGAMLTINWESAVNTLRNSELTIALYNNMANRERYRAPSHPYHVRSLQFDFDRKPTKELGWRDRENDRFLSNPEMADYCLQLLLDQMRSTHFD